MMKNKIGPGAVVTLILVLVFLTVLLGVAKSVIPTAATGYYNLATSLNNATVYGQDAVDFAANTPGYLGWYL